MAISKQPVVRPRCDYCGSVNHTSLSCPNVDNDEWIRFAESELEHRKKLVDNFTQDKLDKERLEQELAKERLERELAKKRLDRELAKKKHREEGITWMVSIIHPSFKNGNTYYSDRAGKNAKEAALSYLMDENQGGELARRDPEMTLIVVIDSRPESLVLSRKVWKVNIFTPRKNNKDEWELIEFS